MQAKSLRLAMAGSRGHHRQLPVVHNAFDQHHTAAFLAKLRTQLASPTVECLRTDARHRRHVVTQWAKDDKQVGAAQLCNLGGGICRDVFPHLRTPDILQHRL